MIRGGVRAVKRAPSWQDIRAVYPPTAVCGAFRMHGAHILPKPARFRMHGARILPRTGDFPVRGRFRDAWSAKLATDCRPGPHRGGILPRQDPPENASRENIATASQAKSASGRNPATVGRWGTHFESILPSSSAWERIASISCHRQTSENAQLRHTATASCPVAQRSPREGVGSGPWLCCGVRRATLSVRGSGHSAFSGLNCWERFRVCAVSVGNHEPASRSAKLCRIMC